MNRDQIDFALGQTPCLCGSAQGWHSECYQGLTQQKVQERYRAVYAFWRRHFARIRSKALRLALNPIDTTGAKR